MADHEEKETLATNAQMTKNHRILNIVQHVDWAVVKQELMKRLFDGVSVVGKDLNDVGVIRNLQAHEAALKLVVEWVSEMEGTQLTEDKLAEAVKNAGSDFIRNLETHES